MSMFCYQCQETARGTGCTRRGVCGKTDEVANLQDLLIWALKGLSVVNEKARELDLESVEANTFVAEGLFATITNANFDPQRFVDMVNHAVSLRDGLLDAIKATDAKAWTKTLPQAATWRPQLNTMEEFVTTGAAVGIQADAEQGDDIQSLRWLLTFGLKGLAAYMDHAAVLDYRDESLFAYLQQALAATLDDSLSVNDLVGKVLECGSKGVATMALLDKANTETFGDPTITNVSLGVVDGPGILISGHDLRDLRDLLEQTQGTGVNVYTHGEMLPANAYPELKKYTNLVGNYGNSWWHQNEEFESFGGPILLTTNCLIPPKDGYIDRLYTSGMVGWPGVPHIADRVGDGQKDFSAIIAQAKALNVTPKELETGTIPIGFAHTTVLSVADKVIEAIQSGALKRFVVMAGCDGRHKSRDYFTQVAEGLPEDSIILTAGCAKYRYNKLGLGDIGGIPRVLDAGQCNDSYSLVVVALKLAEVLGIEDVNDLPIEYDIAWYEQKAVLVLLALLSLGIKRIRLGPTLPAFLSPNVAKVIVDTFDLRPTATVKEDLESIVAGA